MNVQEAKNTVRQWVEDEAALLPGFHGAFYHGSIVTLPDASNLQPSSDVDVVVVLDGPEPQQKPGKFIYRNVLLDVTSLPWELCQSPERILGDHNLAGSFRNPSIISDPTGELRHLQHAVAAEFARRQWVYRRCESARSKILAFLNSVNEDAPFHDNVTSWLFGTGVTTHVLLTAGLRNPTVRKRYLAARDLLADYGRSDDYEPLLTLSGCASVSKTQANHHLANLTEAFDAASSVLRTPFFFTTDISDAARPIAIDGSRELIEQGNHREAMFWIVATYSRCQKIFHHDAPELQQRFGQGYRHLLDDLGIHSRTDLRQRCDVVEDYLPQLWDVAEGIIAENPDVER